MPTKHEIISLDSVAIPAGVTGMISEESEAPLTEPVYQDRTDAPSLYTGAMRPPSDLIAQFTFSTYAQQAALLAWLGFPRNRKERTLRIYSGDPGSLTQVTTPVTIVDITPPQGGGLSATFRRGDVAWKAVSATTEGPTSFAASGTTTFTVGGELPVNPLIKIGWSGQRGTSSTTNGWTYRKRITMTNNGVMALHNQVIQLGPMNTATPISSGKMQSDCNDLCIFNERGERLRKLVYGQNSRGTFLTFVLDELDAGASRTFDLCYGNPNATNDGTTQGFPYSYPGSPTIDITALDGMATAGTTSSLSTGVTVDPNRFLGGTIILTKSATSVAGQMRRVGNHTTGGVYTPTRNFTSAPTSATNYAIVSGPFMGDGGQASATSASSLTDAAQSWYTNEWIGATVDIITLDTAMGAVVQSATVTANTATALTVSSWPSGTPSSSALYRVYKRNANYVYRVEESVRVDTNHRGRWRLNKGQSKPSQIWFASDGAPAAWTPTVYNPGNANNDFNQKRVRDVDMGGGDYDYFAILDASLARKDSQRFREEGFANGCAISIPLGILGVRQDYRVQNPNGMARVFFGCRDRGGDDWESYHEYSTTHASITSRPVAYYDLTTVTPYHLINALTSDDDADIEKTQTGVAVLRDNTILEVRVDSRNLVVSNPDDVTEESVYDLTLNIRRSTSASVLSGDDQVRVGEYEKHLFLASGEKLWIGQIGEIPLACRVYNGSTYVRDVPWQVTLYHVDDNRSGDPTRYYSSDLLPLTPGSQTLRVTDPDGTMGTVNVETTYEARFL